MKKFLLCLILCALSVFVWAEESVVFDFEDSLGYIHEEFNDAGTMFFSQSQGTDKENCLKIDYDFTKSQFDTIGVRLPVSYTSPLNSSPGISFMAKGEKDQTVLLKVSDFFNETYEFSVLLNDSEWHKYSFYFDDENIRVEGGDSNRYMNHPINNIFIGVRRGSKGSVSFDKICSLSKETKKMSAEWQKNALDELEWRLETGKPGNLFYETDDIKGYIIPRYNLLGDFDTEIKLVYKDAFGNFLPSEIKNVKFNTSQPPLISLPEINGYCEIEYTAKFLGQTKKGILRYGVIPDNSKVMAGKRSPFGINTHFNQGWDEYFGDIVKRCGISWIRDGEARLNDNAYPVAKARGLEYMPTFTGVMQNITLGYIFDCAGKGITKRDKWDFAPLVKDFGKYAKKYGDYVSVYDILNEPNGNGWLCLGGDWAGGDWLSAFIQWGKEVSRELKENDPDAKPLWEDSEGFTWSDFYVSSGLDKEIYAVSPHAYNSHRSFPLPEMGLCLLNYPRVKERDRNNNWKYIIGEIGFPTYTETDASRATDMYPGVSELMQAAQTVRVYVMHLNAGAERIFLYDLKNDGMDEYNCECEFGICDFYGDPKPCMCAYSVMVNTLEGCKWTGRQSNDNQSSYIYGYKNRDGEKCVVCWVPSTYFYDGGHGGGPIWTYQRSEGPAYLKTDKKSVRQIDMFGNETVLNAEKGKIKIELSKYPVYIVGL
ncbi:MAG: hypothetical protein KBT47_05705 [Armatimonadetes bacterium]|nr:hypothetical protein [Candidatus Hippobium faecium]